jgi:hypothetical protein
MNVELHNVPTVLIEVFKCCNKFTIDKIQLFQNIETDNYYVTLLSMIEIYIFDNNQCCFKYEWKCCRCCKLMKNFNLKCDNYVSILTLPNGPLNKNLIISSEQLKVH